MLRPPVRWGAVVNLNCRPSGEETGAIYTALVTVLVGVVGMVAVAALVNVLNGRFPGTFLPTPNVALSNLGSLCPPAVTGAQRVPL
jgi:hypothetical protein